MHKIHQRIIALVSLFSVVACSPKLKVAQSKAQLYPISANLPADSALETLISPYRKTLDATMHDVVALSAVEIQKGRPEAPLNNLFADAMFFSGKKWGLNFDIAYTNYGGLRISLPKGEIHRYQVFELMPFENMLALVTFSGKDMQAFFDFMAQTGGEPISGASYTISGKKATDIKVNGQILDANKNYTVLTSDYMANGGDGGVIFSKALKRDDTPYKLRDALFLYLDYFKNNGIQLNPLADGRIKIK